MPAAILATKSLRTTVRPKVLLARISKDIAVEVSNLSPKKGELAVILNQV
jgi:hypothetical protein